LRDVLALPAAEAERIGAGPVLALEQSAVAICVTAAKHFLAVSDQHVSIALIRVIGHTIDIVVLYLGFLDRHLDDPYLIGKVRL
jgi:hypothetical protein